MTLTATVSATGAATGTVGFFDSGTLLGAVPLASGKAALTTAMLTSGVHTILAQYSGDSSDLPGSASVSVQVITPAAPVVTSLVRTGVHLQPT